ncbi:AraC family transcriptional regulator [Paenibacillus cisolokensis]|jgi:AraC-type DNA-binding domain-containing proteins|nr:AraC family transcriptional regulator [Paenibacillus sp. 32O-W]ALS26867.1 AraC family transcriptional regulator [Paenibacillus sp. 32O-W]
MNRKKYSGCRFHFDHSFFEQPLQFGAIELYQIGELCCECGYEIGPHEQICHELSYIVSGEGYFTIGGNRLKVGEGDIIFNPAGSTHAIEADSSSMLRYIYMGFRISADADEAFARINSFFESAPYFRSKDTHNVLIPFLRNIDEFYSRDPYSHVMIRNYFEEIIILTYRTFAAKNADAPRYTPRKATYSVGFAVYSVIRYVENHIFELKSIRAMADELGYSYTYLSHVFKDKTGMTLQRYINYKKIEKALEMLKYGDIPIKQVARRLNYETLQSFSKAFTRIMGYPPSRYAAQQRGREAEEQSSANG